ncbi:hypothetical protein P4641_03620 [Halalkalibacterium halodurans]|uniref:hypothetical protein n=1 Tax=Halalkalibacterium halodurans TaxID=86665 RepID=UPI002E23D123|nr:hypothetical protein [Halalkalibacterium halodurans]
MAEQSVDIFLNRIRKRQKFLAGRFFALTLLMIFTINPLFNASNVTTVFMINSVFLLVTPIMLDYIWGFSTYTLGTNTTRALGILVSSGIFLTCIFCYMSPDVLGVFLFNLSYINYVLWVFPVIAFFDLVFCCNKKELEFYDVTDRLDSEMLTKLKETKDNYYEKGVERTKQKLLKAIGESKGLEGW